MSWKGYDWDGTREETIRLNGHYIAALPAVSNSQNSQTYSAFSLDITSQVIHGSNVLTFTHANWDCSVSDNVKGLQISNQTGVIFSSSTVDPLSCTQSLTYHFDTTSGGSSGGGGGGGGGGGNSTSVPILIGWGGVRLDEAAVGGGIHQPSSPTAVGDIRRRVCVEHGIASFKAEAVGIQHSQGILRPVLHRLSVHEHVQRH